ncbi:23S rRNA (pseudouridine(1915)-N(3))-methyltransferase RlmH [Peptoniphilaceae bacterium SGI.131]
MNVNIIAVGSIKEKFFKDAIKEYEKRLSSYANINLIEIDEYKLSGNPSNKEILEGLEKEGDRILEKIPEKSFLVSLCIEGRSLSSEDLSENIGDIMLEGYSNISFVIGGSFGLSQRVKKASKLKLSFSKMTFPHQLMRVVLLEQIYRAFKIMRNEPYHK